MLQAIYWILAILVMLVLLANAIITIISNIRFNKWEKKNRTELEKQFLECIKEIEDKNEEDK